MSGLDSTITDPAYLCGRIFAVLESIQRAALTDRKTGKGPNTTIADKFFGAAMTSPLAVLVMLRKNATGHLKRLRRDNPGAYRALNGRLDDLFQPIGAALPRPLDLPSQGMFVLGYHHQRAADRSAARAHADTEAKSSTTSSEGPLHDDRHRVAAYLDPARKHDFVFIFDVKDGNPNGDPDAGGMPRTDPETGHDLVTDVAIKRKIRNMVALLKQGEPGYDIYVEAGVSLNAQHERAYATLGLDAKDRKASEPEAQRWMCETFFDVRMFGAVMSTGTKPCGRVQGPVQITFSRSVDPVLTQEHGTTRITQTRQEDIDKGESTEMGAVPYGLYVGYGHYSAPLAARTGATGEDLATLWRALTLMFEHDRASTRGEMGLRRLYIFTHADKFGSAPAYTLFDRVQVPPRADKPARAFADYHVHIDDTDLPPGVEPTRVVE